MISLNKKSDLIISRFKYKGIRLIIPQLHLLEHPLLRQ